MTMEEEEEEKENIIEQFESEGKERIISYCCCCARNSAIKYNYFSIEWKLFEKRAEEDGLRTTMLYWRYSYFY